MIELTLSLEEVNKILESLGRQPYVEVYQLINKIQQQAGSQIEGKNKQPQSSSSESTHSEGLSS